jgi:hypothetical protein
MRAEPRCFSRRSRPLALPFNGRSSMRTNLISLREPEHRTCLCAVRVRRARLYELLSLAANRGTMPRRVSSGDAGGGDHPRCLRRADRLGAGRRIGPERRGDAPTSIRVRVTRTHRAALRSLDELASGALRVYSRELAQPTTYAPAVPDEQRIADVLASEEPFECQECHWQGQQRELVRVENDDARWRSPAHDASRRTGSSRLSSGSFANAGPGELPAF